MAQLFGFFNRACTHQHRGALLPQIFHLVHNGIKLFALRQIHQIGVVNAFRGTVRADFHHVQLVNLPELVGFRHCGTRHTGKFFVEFKEILERNGSQGLVFFFNLQTFFGFYRLVQAIAPPAARH